MIFEIKERFEPNKEILDIIKDYTYKIKKGKIKSLVKTNLTFIEPTEYLITKPTIITIFEYKITEYSDKNFFIKELNAKYTLSEIKYMLKNLK